jgi:hypothetical protein
MSSYSKSEYLLKEFHHAKYMENNPLEDPNPGG